MAKLADIINFFKELICDEKKMGKFKEIIADIKELVSDIKDLQELKK